MDYLRFLNLKLFLSHVKFTNLAVRSFKLLLNLPQNMLFLLGFFLTQLEIRLKSADLLLKFKLYCVSCLYFVLYLMHSFGLCCVLVVELLDLLFKFSFSTLARLEKCRSFPLLGFQLTQFALNARPLLDYLNHAGTLIGYFTL
jgi:hypothetical protein